MAEGCQSCNTCHSCNRCQGCQSCQGCVSCQTCNACESDQDNYPCIMAQTICETTNVLRNLINKTFTFSPSPTDPNTRIGKKTGITSQDNNIFSRESWNAICAWIDERKEYGKEKSDGSFSSFNGTVLTAQEFNRVASTLNSNLRVNPNDLIYGSYFKELEQAARNYRISADCCDKCNATCNTGCKTECEHCQDCQATCNQCMYGLCKDCSSDNQIAQYCA